MQDMQQNSRRGGRQPKPPASLPLAYPMDQACSNGRVLLLGDIHANEVALQAVASHAQAHHCNSTLFMGDITGYGPHPIECVRVLQGLSANGGQWLAGNHDYGLLELKHVGISGFVQSAHTQWVWDQHRTALQKETALWAWLCDAVSLTRADPLSIRLPDINIAAVHANFSDFIGDNVYVNDILNIRENFRLAQNYFSSLSDTLCLLTAHTHMPCVLYTHDKNYKAWAQPIAIEYGRPISLQKEGAFWINIGSVGQPRDGDPRACYAVLDLDCLSITFYRVPYNYQKVQGLMQSLNYPAEFIRRLGDGRVDATRIYEKVYVRREDGQALEVVI